MATDAAMTELLVTVMVLKLWFRDSTGNPSWVGHQDTKGYVEYGRRQTFNRSGEAIVARATIFVGSDVSFSWSQSENEWTVQVDSLSIEFVVVSIEAIIDPQDGSLHHWELLCT